MYFRVICSNWARIELSWLALRWFLCAHHYWLRLALSAHLRSRIEPATRWSTISRWCRLGVSLAAMAPKRVLWGDREIGGVSPIQQRVCLSEGVRRVGIRQTICLVALPRLREAAEDTTITNWAWLLCGYVPHQLPHMLLRVFNVFLF